jgi:hypothetical protein
LDPPGVEEGVAADEQGVGPLARKRCEGRIDLAAGAGVKDVQFQPHGAGSRFRVSHRGLGIWAGRVDEHGNASGCGHQLTQDFQPLCHLFFLHHGVPADRATDADHQLYGLLKG